MKDIFYRLLVFFLLLLFPLPNFVCISWGEEEEDLPNLSPFFPLQKGQNSIGRGRGEREREKGAFFSAASTRVVFLSCCYLLSADFLWNPRFFFRVLLWKKRDTFIVRTLSTLLYRNTSTPDGPNHQWPFLMQSTLCVYNLDSVVVGNLVLLQSRLKAAGVSERKRERERERERQEEDFSLLIPSVVARPTLTKQHPVVLVPPKCAHS